MGQFIVQVTDRQTGVQGRRMVEAGSAEEARRAAGADASVTVGPAVAAAEETLNRATAGAIDVVVDVVGDAGVRVVRLDDRSVRAVQWAVFRAVAWIVLWLVLLSVPAVMLLR